MKHWLISCAGWGEQKIKKLSLVLCSSVITEASKRYKSWVWFYVVLLKLRRAKNIKVVCNEFSSKIYNLYRYTININKIKYIYNYLFPNLMWLTNLCLLSVKCPGTTDLLGCAMHRHLGKEPSPFCIFSNLFSVTYNCKISLKICYKVIKITKIS